MLQAILSPTSRFATLGSGSGSGVDGAVRRLKTEYDTQGNAFRFTSYSDTAGTTVVNQVQRAFNGLGQLTAEYQAHGGAANTGTSLKVQYAYTEMAGSANHSRLASMTYPNGKVLTYNYSSGINNDISRLSSLSDAGFRAFTWGSFLPRPGN